MAGTRYKVAVATLANKYARLLGELNVIEKDAEGAEGVAEIDEAIARIDQRKREIERALGSIEEVIWLFDEKWDPAAVRPIRLQRVKFPPGTISKAGYDILRRADRPMTTREIAREVAVALGVKDLCEVNIAPIDIALGSNLPKRLDAIRLDPGPPKRWSVKQVEQVPSPDDAANTHATPSKRIA